MFFFFSFSRFIWPQIPAGSTFLKLLQIVPTLHFTTTGQAQGSDDTLECARFAGVSWKDTVSDLSGMSVECQGVGVGEWGAGGLGPRNDQIKINRVKLNKIVTHCIQWLRIKVSVLGQCLEGVWLWICRLYSWFQMWDLVSTPVMFNVQLWWLILEPFAFLLHFSCC